MQTGKNHRPLQQCPRRATIAIVHSILCSWDNDLDVSGAGHGMLSVLTFSYIEWCIECAVLAQLRCANGCTSPHRLVVRMSRCGRDNPVSTPGADSFVLRYSVRHARTAVTVQEQAFLAGCNIKQVKQCISCRRENGRYTQLQLLRWKSSAHPRPPQPTPCAPPPPWGESSWAEQPMAQLPGLIRMRQRDDVRPLPQPPQITLASAVIAEQDLTSQCKCKS